MKIFWRFLLLILILTVIFLFYLLYNLNNNKSLQLNAPGKSVNELIHLEDDAYNRLAQSLSYKTISYEGERIDTIEFVELQFHLFQSFPLVSEKLSMKRFSDYGMLFHWQGSDLSLDPIVLMAHQDVVPVHDNEMDIWNHAPFEGQQDAQYIYGRGALDDKGGLLAQFEAFEILLSKGFTPKRSIYLASGHDEEVGGNLGAKSIAEYLANKGVKAEFVLDEGLYILDGFVPGLDKKVAFIGIAEKGYASVKIKIKYEGGHSSIPQKENAITILAEAITKLKNNPFPGELSIPTKEFLRYIGPEMSFLNRLVFANANIFQSNIINIYEKSAAGNAIVRTTTAPTMLQSGFKDNVIPAFAEAVINFRLLPGETESGIKEHINSVLGPDVVDIETIAFSPASSISPINANGFQFIHESIASIYPEVLVAPNLMVGGSDSKYYESISNKIYRFRPFFIDDSNIHSIHGDNEKISKLEYEKAVNFYMDLIERSCN